MNLFDVRIRNAVHLIMPKVNMF
ncbi:hypothetical protein ACHAXR_006770 [Thalassiosira sp. AJA248-18]